MKLEFALVRKPNYYPELIEALQSTLRHLDELKNLSEDDPNLVDLRRSILTKLAEIEEAERRDVA